MTRQFLPLLLLAGATAAHAQSGSEAALTQTGDGNAATVTQMGVGNRVAGPGGAGAFTQVGTNELSATQIRVGGAAYFQGNQLYGRQDGRNTATVTQSGVTNYVGLDQAGVNEATVNTLGLSADARVAVYQRGGEAGHRNTANVHQNNSVGDVAVIEQTNAAGAGNQATITQGTLTNFAKIVQDGSDNRGTISQSGVNNQAYRPSDPNDPYQGEAGIETIGDRNVVSVSQTGVEDPRSEGNFARVLTRGDDNAVEVVQTGGTLVGGHAAEVRIVGDGNRVSSATGGGVFQSGDDHTLFFDATGGAGNDGNTLYFQQTGSANTITGTLTGDLNRVNVRQANAGNTAIVKVNGSGNTAVICQHAGGGACAP